MVFERDDALLVLDPGAFTSPLEDLHSVVAVVLTHEHADHWTPEQLNRILTLNPDARIFGTPATAAAAASSQLEVTAVTPGDEFSVGPFTLRFVGGQHAIIHSSIPQIDNVGVIINEVFYYPGDSFFVPEVSIDVLAAPASAPWMKTAETMDFILAIAPKRCIQSHEMMNSQIGNDMAKARMTWATEQGGGTFSWLAPGEAFQF